MEHALTFGNVTGVMGFIAMVFAGYLHFKRPQEELESSQQEVDNKATLLANQVQWEKDANEKKFTEYGRKLDEVMMKNQKEVVKIDAKLEGFIRSQNIRNEEISNHFTKLFTLIEERLPKKT